MPRPKGERNGRLEDALATLIQNQAAFVGQMRETDKRMGELERINSERFARIEAILLEHSRILAEHSAILQRLPDAVREKMGFKVPEKA
jgi:hypothetical protein